NSELSLAIMAEVADVFYIGGTKNGALLGEAIVIVNPDLQADFRYGMKQHGALLAKGRILGLQFVGLFAENVFFECAAHAHEQSMVLAQGLRDLGCGFLTEPQSNQIFPILPNKVIAALQEKFAFYHWQNINEQDSAVRLVTSWATEPENVNEFLRVTTELLR
ncbi:MAG TPA: beta-eliminating lyase-related protein, partial [Vitreoscilla sp.]|nr:beta-eliminating lyase-related protein [Vitreoscilla sp.]